ncbi:MAG TPA: GNAT family N-acetyltransferase [Ferruginibacter sp.]|jgi:aminoglycoside 3-N-acetyltransferase I|nr:GNAT family N-acetyltransferase [Ferruginibacter sp.]
MDTFQIKRLEKKDLILFQKLIHVFQDVFEMKGADIPEGPQLTKLLENPYFIIFTVCIDNKVIGGLTAYELPSYYASRSEIFIYDIAIDPLFQRKGLGKQLLAALKQYGKEKGISVLFVDANEEDEHAVDFYHTTGGKAANIIQFSYYVDYPA